MLFRAVFVSCALACFFLLLQYFRSVGNCPRCRRYWSRCRRFILSYLIASLFVFGLIRSTVSCFRSLSIVLFPLPALAFFVFVACFCFRLRQARVKRIAFSTRPCSSRSPRGEEASPYRYVGVIGAGDRGNKKTDRKNRVWFWVFSGKSEKPNDKISVSVCENRKHSPTERKQNPGYGRRGLCFFFRRFTHTRI